MGLFDSLFGKKDAAPPAAQPAAPLAVPSVSSEPDPQVTAAIAAAAYVNAAISAAVTAAVIHHTQGGGAVALRFKRPGNLWALSGRQAIMAGRQFN
jgi:hypothetical protein